MMKKELLVPAGNMDCLYQAIHNGADAVYVGCKEFGARKFAANFTNDELIEAIKLCHLYNVKIYATMNTLIKDEEVDAFLKQIEFLHKNSIDAVLIQDFGMMCLILEKYPNLEVHASTQANTSSQDTAELFYKLGVKRVVFSREMSIEEINKITVPIEKEVFIHGALCISYSGCCLMSSMIGTRSGNRGECAGSCRLPYTLEHKGNIISDKKYLLSTKELNTSPKIDALLESNIDSFKIEGRMKSPEYVGFITRFYRSLIDKKEQFDLDAETNKLKAIFNRNFTKGYLFNESPSKLVNQETPNHIGLKIGQVIKVTPKKITIKIDKNQVISQQDGIRFLNSKKGLIINYLYDANDKLIKESRDICIIDNKVELKENDIVCKTLDYNLQKQLQKLPKRKIPIFISVTAKLNKPIEVVVKDGVNEFILNSINVEKSISSPTSKERVVEQLTKLGNSPFICEEIKADIDEDIFIPIKELNDMRHTFVEELMKKRTTIKTDITINDVKFDAKKATLNRTITASVTTEEQLKECLDLNVSRVYVSNKLLYEKYKENSKIYYRLPRCLLNIKDNLKERTLVSEYFSFDDSKNLVGSYGLNVYNIYTAYYLQKYNLNSICLSKELTEREVENLLKNYFNKFNSLPNIEYVAYGKAENMVIKGNILSIKENEYNYNLIDIKNRKFKVYFDEDSNRTYILNYENDNNIPSPFIKNNCSIRLDFYNENKYQVKEVVKKYQ